MFHFFPTRKQITNPTFFAIKSILSNSAAVSDTHNNIFFCWLLLSLTLSFNVYLYIYIFLHFHIQFNMNVGENVKICWRFHVICNWSEREKKIQEIVILPCQEITLSVLYLWITLIYHALVPPPNPLTPPLKICDILS